VFLRTIAIFSREILSRQQKKAQQRRWEIAQRLPPSIWLFSVSGPRHGLRWALKQSASDRCTGRDADGKSFDQID
jgi:hypothetical protein